MQSFIKTRISELFVRFPVRARRRFPGEFPGRQRGGDGKLVGRLRGRHAAHAMDGLAEDTPTVLQDQETCKVRAVLGFLRRTDDRLPRSRYTLQSGD